MRKTSYLLYTLFEKLFPGRFSRESFLLSTQNIQWVGISKLASMVISFVTTSIVARAFGPEKFGTLNYILSFIGLFSILASLGISAVVYKDLIKEKENREEILGTAMALTFITGILTIGIIALFLYITGESLSISLMTLLAAVSFLTQPFNLLQIDFLKDSEAKYATITQLITSLIANFGKIIVVSLFASVWYFIVILVCENFLAGMIYIYQITKVKKRSFNLTFSQRRVTSLLYAAAPMALTLGFSDIYAKIDQVMLRHYLDISTVGIYAAAARVTELWYFIPNVIITGLFPMLAHTGISNEERKRRFLFLSKALFISASLITLFVAIFSNFIIGIIYGGEFSEAAPILVVYIFSLFGTFMSLLILQELFIENKNWAIILIPACTAILNVVLNIFLIPAHGTIGAAFATVVSYNIIPLVYYITKK